MVSPYLSGSDGGLYVVLLFLGYPGMLGRRVVNNQHPDSKPHTTNGTWWNREPNFYLVSDEIQRTIHWHEVQANCNKNGFIYHLLVPYISTKLHIRKRTYIYMCIIKVSISWITYQTNKTRMANPLRNLIYTKSQRLA